MGSDGPVRGSDQLTSGTPQGGSVQSAAPPAEGNGADRQTEAHDSVYPSLASVEEFKELPVRAASQRVPGGGSGQSIIHSTEPAIEWTLKRLPSRTDSVGTTPSSPSAPTDPSPPSISDVPPEPSVLPGHSVESAEEAPGASGDGSEADDDHTSVTSDEDVIAAAEAELTEAAKARKRPPPSSDSSPSPMKTRSQEQQKGKKGKKGGQAKRHK